jgi:hypothetical protein
VRRVGHAFQHRALLVDASVLDDVLAGEPGARKRAMELPPARSAGSLDGRGSQWPLS